MADAARASEPRLDLEAQRGGVAQPTHDLQPAQPVLHGKRKRPATASTGEAAGNGGADTHGCSVGRGGAWSVGGDGDTDEGGGLGGVADGSDSAHASETIVSYDEATIQVVLQALLDAKRTLRQPSFAPIDGADGWQMRWQWRAGTCGKQGDAYFQTPGEMVVRSLPEARRWMEAGGVAGDRAAMAERGKALAERAAARAAAQEAERAQKEVEKAQKAEARAAAKEAREAEKAEREAEKAEKDAKRAAAKAAAQKQAAAKAAKEAKRAAAFEAKRAAAVIPKDASEWVQCDKCDKWRLLPPGVALDPDTEWHCEMHPDVALASCDEPEDSSGTEAWVIGGQERTRRAAKALDEAETAGLSLLKRDAATYAHVLPRPSHHGTPFVAAVPLDGHGLLQPTASISIIGQSRRHRELGEYATAEEAALASARFVSEYQPDFEALLSALLGDVSGGESRATLKGHVLDFYWPMDDVWCARVHAHATRTRGAHTRHARAARTYTARSRGTHLHGTHACASSCARGTRACSRSRTRERVPYVA
eukprot:7381294-Prymnesium_polylepis.2